MNQRCSNIINRLNSRQIARNSFDLTVPRRQYSLVDIRDKYSEIFKTIILGFTPDGNHISTKTERKKERKQKERKGKEKLAWKEGKDSKRKREQCFFPTFVFLIFFLVSYTKSLTDLFNLDGIHCYSYELQSDHFSSFFFSSFFSFC